MEDIAEDLNSSVTQVHVTTLDEVVSVNSSFCVAVFIGLSFSPNPGAIAPLAPADPHCQVSDLDGQTSYIISPLSLPYTQ